MKRDDDDDNDDIKIYDLESKLGHVTYFDMTHPQKATNTIVHCIIF